MPIVCYTSILSWFIAAQHHLFYADCHDCLTSKWLGMISPLVAGFHSPLNPVPPILPNPYAPSSVALRIPGQVGPDWVQVGQPADTPDPRRIVETGQPLWVYKLCEIDLTKTGFEPCIQAFSTLAASPGRLLVPDRRRSLPRTGCGGQKRFLYVRAQQPRRVSHRTVHQPSFWCRRFAGRIVFAFAVRLPNSRLLGSRAILAVDTLRLPSRSCGILTPPSRTASP